jgi:hypothetical protein
MPPTHPMSPHCPSQISTELTQTSLERHLESLCTLQSILLFIQHEFAKSSRPEGEITALAPHERTLVTTRSPLHTRTVQRCPPHTLS